MNPRQAIQQRGRDIVLNALAGSYLLPRTIRFCVYRAWGLRLRTRHVMPHCFVGGTRLSIGRGCFVNYGCFFDTSAPIDIGDRCHLGMQVMLCTSTHEQGDQTSRAGTLTSAPIHIGDGVWLGARVTVLPGVSIEDGCIVGSGSVVTRDCAASGLYAGNPARRLRDIGREIGRRSVMGCV